MEIPVTSPGLLASGSPSGSLCGSDYSPRAPPRYPTPSPPCSDTYLESDSCTSDEELFTPPRPWISDEEEEEEESEGGDHYWYNSFYFMEQEGRYFHGGRHHNERPGGNNISIANWSKDNHLDEPLKAGPGVDVSYNLSSGETIVFVLEPRLGKHLGVIFAYDSSTSTLYQLETLTPVDHHLIHADTVHFFKLHPGGHYESRGLCPPPSSSSSSSPSPPTSPSPTHHLSSKIHTYNLRTRQLLQVKLDNNHGLWQQEQDYISNIMSLINNTQLSLPYPPSPPSLKGHWPSLSTDCIVDNTLFRFQIKINPKLHYRNYTTHLMVYVVQENQFVLLHDFNFDDYLKDFCYLFCSKSFLIHITELRFCLLVFFASTFEPAVTNSVCIFTFELARFMEPISFQDPPNSNPHKPQDLYNSKARKVESYIYKFCRVVNKKAFKLPTFAWPESCVKVCCRENSSPAD